MMITRLFAVVALLTCLTTSVSAQSWRSLRNQAQDLEEAGNFYEAAQLYRQAWEKRQGREELIYAAAENFMRVREYRAAAEAYSFLQAEQDDYPLIGLKYARALKQDGQYDKAREAFQRFLEGYNGSDRTIVEDIVRTELRGLDLAQDLANRTDRRLQVTRPGNTINSESNEFGPAPVGTDQLYFTSTMGGQSRVYASTRQGQSWTKATTPQGFPVIQNGQFGSGTMSPDGQRFYFTICNSDGGWQGLNTRCEIFATRRSGTGWGQPERLPDYINAQGRNTTHPTVVHIAGQELLYFSSNRDGGRGGMDLWYAVRDLGLDNNDFTFPVNLGPVINTLGDEISPFYSVDERALYFSSNGQPTIGGQDVFKALGEEINWSQPENVGLPINSSADDYGYVLDRTGFGNGFFVSNRVFGGEKTNTRDSDIFEFSVGGRQITLRSNVYDQSAGTLLDNVTVSLYQIFDDGTENMLVTKQFPQGSYLFELLPNRRFRVEVSRPGYMTGSYTFSTNDPNTVTYGQPLFLEVDTRGNAGTQPGTGYPANPNYPSTGNPTYPNTGNPTYPTTTNPTGTVRPNPTNPVTPSPSAPINTGGGEYTARGQSATDNLEYTSTAPRYQGTYFKIQLAAVGNFDPGNQKYQSLSGVGQIETEVLPNRSLTRVLLANFFNEADLRNALQRVRQVFPGAYAVRYDNGVRYGRVNF